MEQSLPPIKSLRKIALRKPKFEAIRFQFAMAHDDDDKPNRSFHTLCAQTLTQKIHMHAAIGNDKKRKICESGRLA